jgi:hypothetical protein
MDDAPGDTFIGTPSRDVIWCKPLASLMVPKSETTQSPASRLLKKSRNKEPLTYEDLAELKQSHSHSDELTVAVHGSHLYLLSTRQ